MPIDPAVPRPFEVRFAYATALVASLAWVACVMPGARLEDPAALDDLATPMHRGAAYLVPALFLLIATPIAAVLARHAMALRGLLAWSSVFVTVYAAVVVWAGGPRAFGWIVVAALLVLAAVSVRDALRIGRAGSEAVPGARGFLSRKAADLRLALSLFALLTPSGVLMQGSEERASLLIPFVFVALGAGGERWAKSLFGLRLSTAMSLAIVAGHLVVGVRYAIDEGHPASVGWTAWGASSLALAALVFVLVVGWSVGLVTLLMRQRRLRHSGDDASPSDADEMPAPQGSPS